MNALDRQTVAQCAQLVDFDQVERAGMSLRLDRFNFSGASAGARSSGAALRRPHIFAQAARAAHAAPSDFDHSPRYGSATSAETRGHDAP